MSTLFLQIFCQTINGGYHIASSAKVTISGDITKRFFVFPAPGLENTAAMDGN
jgi:hypothetical protein